MCFGVEPHKHVCLLEQTHTFPRWSIANQPHLPKLQKSQPTDPSLMTNSQSTDLHNQSALFPRFCPVPGISKTIARGSPKIKKKWECYVFGDHYHLLNFPAKTHRARGTMRARCAQCVATDGSNHTPCSNTSWRSRSCDELRQSSGDVIL